MDETSGEHKPEPKNENDSVISIKVKDQQGQEVSPGCLGGEAARTQRKTQRSALSLTRRLAVAVAAGGTAWTQHKTQH